MANIYVNDKSGLVAKASDLAGIKELAEDLHFKILINDYRSFFYGIYRRHNPDTGQYEFRKVSKVNKQMEQMLFKQGYEKIKDAYSNEIPEQYLWKDTVVKENLKEGF